MPGYRGLASPAACAAVMGKLKRAGIPRSREIGYIRQFTQGFDAFPSGDHIQVVYLQWDGDVEAIRSQMLDRAVEALAGYDIKRCHGLATAVGGQEEQDYLEVRSEKWGR